MTEAMTRGYSSTTSTSIEYRSLLHPASITFECVHSISSVHTGYQVSTLRGVPAVLQRSTAVLHYRAMQYQYKFIINIQYNMYHMRPLDAQKSQPIPMPEGGQSERPKSESRPPHGMGIAGLDHLEVILSLLEIVLHYHYPDSTTTTA
jgi:hypothetical protein